MVSFFSVVFITPLWIKKAKQNDLVGRDIHKRDGRKVAEMGGICVIIGFLFGTLAYIGITEYIDIIPTNHVMTLAILCSVLITTIIGIIDDILGWKIGLRQYQKPVLTLAAVVPIAILFSQGNTVDIPFVGIIDFGNFYPLLLVPLILLFTTNSFNMLAGYNGLETGMGIIILSTLGLFAFSNLAYWPGVIAFIMVFALVGFLVFNMYPASVFPGDSLTYSVGVLIGIIGIMAHLEKLLFFLCIPYFIEFILKMRGLMQKESFAKVNKKGGLYINHIYGIEHAVIKLLSKFTKKVTERQVVMSIWAFEIGIAVLYWGVLRWYV